MRRRVRMEPWCEIPCVAMTDERLAATCFLAAAVLVGGNGVAIRFSNRELDPLWGAGLRFTLAAALLGLVMGLMRLELPRGRALWGAVLFGLLDVGAAFALAYYALVEVHAGFGMLLLAVVPLVTLLLAALWRQERLHRAGVIGAVLALTGVAIMSRAPLREGVPLLSVLAGLGSALCVAQATVFVRMFPRVHPVTMNVVAMAAGALVLLMGAGLTGETIALPDTSETWTALAYLVLGGSAIVFVLFIIVLRHWTASRTAYLFVVSPIFALGLSAWLDEEPVSSGLVLGGALVLAGVYVGALRQQRPEDQLPTRPSRTSSRP